MLYLRATVALVAAMTFSSTALGQTRPAIAVFTAPSGPRAPALVPDATSASFDKSIARYMPPPNFILGIAEINLITCGEIEPGKWITDPNPTLKPKFKGTPAGTVGFERIQSGKAQGGPCDGHTYDFAAIDFSWSAEYNQTALDPTKDSPPPCKNTNPVCPTAVFMSEWTTKDGMFDIKYTFRVSVDVVRPSGETTKWQGWSGWFGGGLVGMWEATLKPPTSDKDFDFTGETTRERFSGKRDSCKVKTTNNIPLGNIVSHGKSFPVVDGPPGKYVDGVSTGGDDPQSACSVLCNFVTHPAGCFLTVQQQMSIKSPADMDFVEYPAVNILEATSLGSIINDFLRGTRGKATVTSNRYPISEPRPTPQSHESDLSLSNCTSINIPITPTTSRKFIFPEDCSK